MVDDGAPGPIRGHSYGSAGAPPPRGELRPMSIEGGCQEESDGEGWSGGVGATVAGDGARLRLRLLFGLMGAGTLFPYNAVISCADYYNAAYPDANDVAGSLAAWCLTALLATTVVLLPLSASAKPAQAHLGGAGAGAGADGRPPPPSRRSLLSSPVRRMALGYGMCLVLLVLLAALRDLPLAALRDLAFLLGVADATSQSGLYVYAASCGIPSYSAAVTVGSAAAGLLAGLLRIATRASLGEGDGAVAAVYWASSGVIVACLWAVRAATGRLRGRPGGSGDGDRGEEGLDGLSPSLGPSQPSVGSGGEPSPRDSRLGIYLETIRITWKPTLAAFLNFFVTLSLFPGTVSSIPSFREGGGLLHLGEWLPIVLITTFNAADCAGRAVLSIDRLGIAGILLSRREAVQQITAEGDGRGAMTGGDPSGAAAPASQGAAPATGPRVLLPNIDVLVWYHSLSRILSYPLLALCVLPGTPHPIVSSDLLRIAIIFVFGFSNGFVNCAAFMTGPVLAIGSGDERHRDAASLLLLLAIYSGLAFGSYFGLVVDAAMRSGS